MAVTPSPLPYVGGSMTSPFEDWCDLHRVHPEALGAWEAYQAETAEYAATATAAS